MLESCECCFIYASALIATAASLPVWPLLIPVRCAYGTAAVVSVLYGLMHVNVECCYCPKSLRYCMPPTSLQRSRMHLGRSMVDSCLLLRQGGSRDNGPAGRSSGGPGGRPEWRAARSLCCRHAWYAMHQGHFKTNVLITTLYSQQCFYKYPVQYLTSRETCNVCHDAQFASMS